MPNPRYNNVQSRNGGKADYSEQADGPAPSTSMPMKTANWPGLPGKAGPNRANGTPKEGHCGPFFNKKEGM